MLERRCDWSGMRCWCRYRVDGIQEVHGLYIQSLIAIYIDLAEASRTRSSECPHGVRMDVIISRCGSRYSHDATLRNSLQPTSHSVSTRHHNALKGPWHSPLLNTNQQCSLKYDLQVRLLCTLNHEPVRIRAMMNTEGFAPPPQVSTRDGIYYVIPHYSSCTLPKPIAY